MVAQQQELLLEDWGEPGELSNERDNVSNVQQPSTIEYVDTFGVFYVHEDNPNQIYTVQDSSLLNFHRYDPVQQGLFSYANTGILGSPARPLFYETRDRQGFDVGFHQFDAYYIQPTEVRFYILDKAYAKFRANIGNSQQDRMFTATFGRKFANGWQFSLEASSILEESGFKFPRQQLSDRALGVGLRYQSDNGRYQSFITLTSNTTVAQENGGIQILPERGVSFVSPANAQPILSNGANTRHAHRTLGYTQYLNLQGTEKGRNKRAFQLSHQLQYRSSTYKY
ncbi:MAG: putative porin, partial [Bacteroidota bacterium]